MKSTPSNPSVLMPETFFQVPWILSNEATSHHTVSGTCWGRARLQQDHGMCILRAAHHWLLCTPWRGRTDLQELPSQRTWCETLALRTLSSPEFPSADSCSQEVPFGVCCPQLLVGTSQRGFLCRYLGGTVSTCGLQGVDWSCLPRLYFAGCRGSSFPLGGQQALGTKKLPVNIARSRSIYNDHDMH